MKLLKAFGIALLGVAIIFGFLFTEFAVVDFVGKYLGTLGALIVWSVSVLTILAYVVLSSETEGALDVQDNS